MSSPFDNLEKHIVETSLKYDDHTAQQRKELENILTKHNQPLKTGKVIVKVPIKPAAKKTNPKQLEFDFKAKSEPMNIDISLPPELTKLLEGK